MSEEQQKKKKKKRQINISENEQIESKILPELVDALHEAAKEKKYVDIQVCPKCKSPLVHRVDSLGNMWTHIGITPPNYQCRECGWRQKIVLKTTNKPTTINEVAVMADAKDDDTERRRKKWFR